MNLYDRLFNRRLWVCGLLVLQAAVLAGCGTPLPPPQLYQLRSAAPVERAAGAGAADLRAALALQLQLPVALPELLDRDSIVVAQGQAGVQVLSGHRWAEPLRDAVPRLLRQDLAALMGNGTVWVAPLPAGLVVQRLLRVELLTLQADRARSSVQLLARWTLSDPTGRTPVRTQLENLTVPVVGSDIDALVVSHRLVLWRLAERLAQSVVQQP